eukprot:jgi/Tetstr1/432476/TSEL_021852.t1
MARLKAARSFISSSQKAAWLTATGLALVLAAHFVRTDLGWLPHSRRAPQMAEVHVTASSHSAGGSARVRVRVELGRGATAREGGGEGEPLVPAPQGAGQQQRETGRKRLTKRENNIRRENNLKAHLNGSYVAQPPAFEFSRNGLPGGVLGVDPPGEPPIHLLDKANLHLNQAQFDRDGTRGGIRPGRERTGRIISASLTYPVLGPDGTSVDAHYSFNPADVSFVPPRQLDLSYGRCAGVAGYERHVGSKATFDMVNSKHASDLSRKVMEAFHSGRSLLDQSRNTTSMVLFEATNWHRNYYTYSRLLQKLPPPQLLILSPDFVNELCNRITLYGFENVTAAAVNDTSHYFDDEPANLAAHSYSLTQTVLHHLASMYLIDIRGG